MSERAYAVLARTSAKRTDTHCTKKAKVIDDILKRYWEMDNGITEPVAAPIESDPNGGSKRGKSGPLRGVGYSEKAGYYRDPIQDEQAEPGLIPVGFHTPLVKRKI